MADGLTFCCLLNSLWPRVPYGAMGLCQHWPGNGLLSGDTKPIHELILTSNQLHVANLQVSLYITATTLKSHRVNLQFGLYNTAMSLKGHGVDL